jgi:hypothetical protein
VVQMIIAQDNLEPPKIISFEMEPIKRNYSTRDRLNKIKNPRISMGTLVDGFLFDDFWFLLVCG